MAHDVFICSAPEDQAVGKQACAVLEERGLRCWFAPRDLKRGADEAKSSLEAVRRSRILVLVLSSAATNSDPVGKLVELADNGGVQVVTFSTEATTLRGPLAASLSSSYWIDASTSALEEHFGSLSETVVALLPPDEVRKEESLEEEERPPVAVRPYPFEPPAPREPFWSRLGGGFAVWLGVAIVVALVIAGFVILNPPAKEPEGNGAGGVVEEHSTPDEAALVYIIDQGVAYAAQGDFKSAIGRYTKAIQIDPRSVNAFTHRAFARTRTGDLPGAIDDAGKAIALDDRHAAAFLHRGYARSLSGDPDGAMADLNTAIKIDSSMVEAYIFRGNVYEQMDEFELAILEYTRAIDLDPESADPYLSRGNARNRTGDVEGMIEDYTHAIDIDPTLAQAYNNRGVAYQEQQRFAEAVADFSQTILIDPDFAEAYHNRGLIHAELGEDARDDLIAAATSYARRADESATRSDWSNAVADYRRALSAAPDDWRDRKRVEDSLQRAEARLTGESGS